MDCLLKKGVGSNYILWQFCRWWVHKKGIRGKRKKDSKFKCQTCEKQRTDTARDCPGIELNGQSLKIQEKFCYPDDAKRAGGGAVDSAMTRIRSRWSKFRD